MSAHLSLESFRRVLGGRISGDVLRCPGPEHGPGDEPLLIRTGPEYAGGFWVKSFSTRYSDWRQLRDWVRERMRIPFDPEAPRAEYRLDPKVVERRRREREAKIDQARSDWRRTGKAGAAVRAYLAARGITIPIPPTIRERTSPGWYPEMVVAVADINRNITGTQATRLRPDGRGKAPVRRQRHNTGVLEQGAVRLAPRAQPLWICEGTEDALSVLQVGRARCAWAALGGMSRLVLPFWADHVVIGADADDAGRNAAEQASQRWRDQGRDVRIEFPPEGKDWNDFVRLRSRAA